jgi:DNA modification methylase
MLIVGQHVSQNPNDKQEVAPALAVLSRLPDDLGSIAKAAADSGYFSKDNTRQFEKAAIEPYMPNGRQHHNPTLEERFAQVPEAPKESQSKIGDLYELGSHRLLCGDSSNKKDLEVLTNGIKADMVFTDPPYGINAVSKSGVLKESYGVDILGDSNTNAACDAFSLIYSLYPNATHIWWGANHYSLDAKLPNAKCWLTWDKQEKNNHIDQADCELAWTNINSPARIFHHLWAGFRRDSEKGEKRVHPTQKPIQLISEILQHFKKVKSELILDLFLGSGSTMVACEQLKRKCYGMELDPKYCQVIIDRMKKLDPSLIIKRNGEVLN